MIDIENYKRAIAWLRRSLNELQQEPGNQVVRLSILHRFEVTHSITEALLRQVYVLLGVDDQAAVLSLRELVRRAREKGIRFTSPMQWLQYGLILECAQVKWLETAEADLAAILPILPRYAAELDAFAESLEQRMATLV